MTQEPEHPTVPDCPTKQPVTNQLEVTPESIPGSVQYYLKSYFLIVVCYS